MISGSKRRRLRDRRGSVTVEFMLSLFPFMLLILGIIEVGLISFSSATLRNGAYEASRVTKTNSQGCLSRAQIETLICENTLFAPGCTDRLSANRRVLAQGWDSDATAVSGGADDDSDGASGSQVVVVEATYRWQPVSPLIGPIIGDANGELPISQRFVFQTEPFGDSSCPAS